MTEQEHIEILAQKNAEQWDEIQRLRSKCTELSKRAMLAEDWLHVERMENERLWKAFRLVLNERNTYKQAVEGLKKAFEALEGSE